MTKRKRFRQFLSLEDRLTMWADCVRDDTENLRPGPARDKLLKKARVADTAARSDDWVEWPNLRPAKPAAG